MNKLSKNSPLDISLRPTRLRIPASIVLGVLAAFVFLPLCFAQKGKPEISPLEAVQRLHLPHRAGPAQLYFSPGYRERAVKVQYRLQDMLAFYKEKLGINTAISVAVLDQKDWNRIAQQLQNTQQFPPYGMTNVQADRAGRNVIAFIPADNNGVITKSQLADRPYATAAALKTFASIHLTYDQAARLFIMHPAFHELGHLLTVRYGIDPPDRWVDEMMASYFAYSYEKARDPEVATLVEGFTKMSSPPIALTSLDQFEQALAGGKQMAPANYVWYQRHFEARIVEVYRDKGLSFFKAMKSEFPVPPGGARPDGQLTVSQTLSRMEHVDPGFEAWAKKLAEYKPQADPQIITKK